MSELHRYAENGESIANKELEKVANNNKQKLIKEIILKTEHELCMKSKV